ncbi:hypothetical protein niasHT_033096 [Heterodera trifolii]|uniref:Microtubule-associated protein n=1 Tax=Heterodera trifolii TaxID=157864 RepID=A0ABD2J780_9BILA
MSDNEDELTTIQRRRRLTEGTDEKSRFRPPLTPSNSLLLRSPPVIMITSPSLPNSREEHLAKQQVPSSNGNGTSSSASSSAGTTRVNHPPQPFPVPLQRRRSSCSSSVSSPLGSAAFHPRYSTPRLSITSLGSVAKTFRNIAAFIVPEEEGERERARDRLRKKAMMRGGSVATETQRRRGSGRVFEFFPGLKVAETEPKNKMIPSTAVPRPLRSSNQQKQQPNALTKQNGAHQQKTPIKAREGSRNRNDALGAQKPNGHSPRTPSVPPVNKRYAHVKSKVGSITEYTPSPSQVKIFHESVRVSATPKVGSLQNASHVPAGGNVTIENRKLNFREAAKPRVEDKSEVPIPKSEKKIATQKLEWKAQSKVGSLDNVKHKPAGGNLKIFHESVRVKCESKVGSLDNIGHVPGGGNVKVSDYARSVSGNGDGSRRDTFDSGRSSSSADLPKTKNVVLSPQRSPRPVEMILTPKEIPPTDDDEQNDANRGHIGQAEERGGEKRNGESATEEETPQGTKEAETGQLINFGD